MVEGFGQLTLAPTAGGIGGGDGYTDRDGIDGLGVIPTTVEMTGLAVYIQSKFKENADHRMMSGIDSNLLSYMLAARGKYTEADKAKFRECNLPENIFTPLTGTKIRAALAQLSEIFTSPGDKPWKLSPTPMPEVPKSVQKQAWMKIVNELVMLSAMSGGKPPTPEQAQQFAYSRMDEVIRKQQEWAHVRAERMERVVYDQLIEGGWIEAFQDFCNYVCEMGTGIIRGPIPRVMYREKVKENEKYGTLTCEMEPKEVLCYDAVNPWDCYPSKGAKKITQGNLCIRTRYSAEDLYQFATCAAKKSHEDGEWFADTVNALLERYPEGGVRLDTQSYDIIRQRLENNGVDTRNDCTLEGIDFYGNVRGSMLIQIGIVSTKGGEDIDPKKFYEINAISIAGYIVYCKILDKAIGRPLSKGTFYRVPDSWWGECIAGKLDSAQRVVNAALRNLVNNMAMTSGPQLFLKDADRLVDKGPGKLKLRPFKVWQFNTGGFGQTDVPLGSIDIPSHVAELLKVFDWAKQQADEDSGIPAYTYGQNAVGGAGRTASGLAMLTEAANRGMKMVVTSVDMEVIRTTVRRTVTWNMIYSDDQTIKGDCEVNPAGVMGLILKEQESNRRKQMLATFLNPLALQIFGPKPVVEIAREEIKSLGMKNVDDMMPSKEEQEFQQQVMQLQQFNSAMQPQIAAQGQRQTGGGSAGGGEAPAPEAESGGMATAQANSIQNQISEDAAGFATQRGLVSQRRGAA